jgi:putative glycosyltransferase (TIGR04372 family)
VKLPADLDAGGFFQRTKPHLSFTPEEERLGWADVSQLGLPEEAPFVCVFARDPAYLDVTYPHLADWRHHNFRDADIEDFMTAAEELAGRGYYVLRMGAVVAKPLRQPSAKIIDYAANGRSDFLDIFLGANCRFFLGTYAGIMAVPMIFRRPVVAVNLIPLTLPTRGRDDMLLPKKLWWREKRRFMTFREMLDCGFLRSQEYAAQGIEIIDNTPEEIRSVAIEADERLKGTWRASEEDEELQARFRALFTNSHVRGRPSRLGTAFLRENIELLD